MTDTQAARIKELRMNGLEYRTIADSLGLTRDIVRNYCKANNMGGYAKSTALNIQERMAEGKVYVYCGIVSVVRYGIKNKYQEVLLLYPVSEAFLQAVQENTRKYHWTGRIITKTGAVHEFGNEDIVKGAGYISSQCCDSAEIEIGTVYAAEMGITLFSEIDRYTLEDAKVELFNGEETNAGIEIAAKEQKKQLHKAALQAEDMAKGVYILLSSLPHWEPQIAANTPRAATL